MPHTIYINRDFDNQLVKEVKSALRELPPNEKEIAFRINSYGGNGHCLNVIRALIYFMRKYKKCKIIGQAVHTGSAALALFLYCDVRQVNPKSVGLIHLSVPNKKYDGDLASLERSRQQDVEFIKSRTKMTEKEIRIYQNCEFRAAKMMELGIATEMVDYFR